MSNEKDKPREKEFADYFRISMQQLIGDPKMLFKAEQQHKERILTKFVVKQHNLMAYGFNDGSVIILGKDGVTVFNNNAVLMAMIQKGEKLSKRAREDRDKTGPRIAISNKRKLDS